MKSQNTSWPKYMVKIMHLYIHAIGQGGRENWMDSFALSNWKYETEERISGISCAHFWLMFEDLQQMGVHFSSHKE